MVGIIHIIQVEINLRLKISVKYLNDCVNGENKVCKLVSKSLVNLL